MDAQGRAYVILGIHDPAEQRRHHGRATVDAPVARVRFFLAPDAYVDEDVPLPSLPASVPKAEHIYEDFLRDGLIARHAVLAAEHGSDGH